MDLINDLNYDELFEVLKLLTIKEKFKLRRVDSRFEYVIGQTLKAERCLAIGNYPRRSMLPFPRDKIIPDMIGLENLSSVLDAMPNLESCYLRNQTEDHSRIIFEKCKRLKNTDTSYFSCSQWQKFVEEGKCSKSLKTLNVKLSNWKELFHLSAIFSQLTHVEFLRVTLHSAGYYDQLLSRVPPHVKCMIVHLIPDFSGREEDQWISETDLIQKMVQNGIHNNLKYFNIGVRTIEKKNLENICDHFTKIEQLSLIVHGITNFSVFNKLPFLRKLNLINISVSDIGTLFQAIPNVTQLQISSKLVPFDFEKMGKFLSPKMELLDLSCVGRNTNESEYYTNQDFLQLSKFRNLQRLRLEASNKLDPEIFMAVTSSMKKLHEVYLLEMEKRFYSSNLIDHFENKAKLKPEMFFHMTIGFQEGVVLREITTRFQNLKLFVREKSDDYRNGELDLLIRN